MSYIKIKRRNNGDNYLRKVWCLGLDNNYYWAYKDDADNNCIPNRLYKANFPYEMLDEEVDNLVEFKRWCTLFDA